MEWGRLYANLADDPRVQRAERDAGAGWLLIESMCYCTHAETGGFIPDTQIERFAGGSRKPKKIEALVRERIWIPVEDGYMLDPDLWTEERNLSDSAEKKREADRRRIADKRARERTERESRDSRATGRATEDMPEAATCRRDSRTPEKRRQELPMADVIGHPTVRSARARDDDDHELVAAVVDAVLVRTERVLTPPEARTVAARVLARGERSGVRVHRPARYVAQAIADERDLSAELMAGLWQPATPPARLAERPAWCGERYCDEGTRRREDPETGDDLGPCPLCSSALPLPRLEAS